jgi:hypothetical protein
VWWLCAQAVDALETPHGDDSGVTLPRPASIRPFAASASASAAVAGKEASWDAEDGAEDGTKRRGSAMEVENFRCGPAVPVACRVDGRVPFSPPPLTSHLHPASSCCLCLFARATIQAVPLIVHEVTGVHFYWGAQCSSGYTGAHPTHHGASPHS